MADYNNKNGRPGGRGDRGNRPFGERKFGGKPERDRGERRFEGKPYGERKFGDKPYGERKFGDKPYGERKFGDKPYGERKFGDKPYGERKFGDKPYGERKFEGRPFGDKKFGDRPDFERGERRFEGKPFGERKFEGKPYGERKFGDKPYGERKFEGRPFGDKKFGDKPDFERGERRFEGKPFGERKFEGKPYGERKFGDKPYGERKFEGRPFGDKKFGDKPDFERGERRFGKPGFDRRPERPEFGPRPMPEEGAEQRPEELPNIIMGRNPVREAIRSGRSIDRILVTKEHDGSLGEIISLAKDRNLIIREVDRRKLDELCMPFGHDGKSGNHQGVVAEIPGVEYSELSDILAYAEERGEKPFVILLDGVEDPHNLGSVIRSAECAGAHGVVIPKRRSAPVTAAVVKTSAGAAEHMRIARVVNIVSAMEELKQAGLWIAGADMAGESMHKVDMKGAFALVVGGEGDGLSKLVREKCDFLVSIPLKGSIDSLNAAVAAAIIMFEKNRQDGINE